MRHHDPVEELAHGALTDRQVADEAMWEEPCLAGTQPVPIDGHDLREDPEPLVGGQFSFWYETARFRRSLPTEGRRGKTLYG